MVKVVIIGAGIAGISAAKFLLEGGITDIKIVEGRDRPGGRIHAVPFYDGQLEIGAQFIHGSDGNPLHELAEQYQELGVTSPYSEENHLFYLSDGTLLDSELSDETCRVVDELLEDANKFARNNITEYDSDASIGSFLLNEFEKYLQSEERSEKAIEQQRAVFNWRLLQEKTDNACDSLFEMSLLAWGQYLEFPGEPYIELQKGFTSLLSKLIQSLPEGLIQYKSRVSRVDWTDNGCQVFTTDGQWMSAEHVICTCPVGYLKKHAHSMFRPPLPTKKLAVIHRFGYGTVDKIYLEFDEPFWDCNYDGIQFAWLDKPVRLDSIEKLPAKERGGEWYRAIQGFDVMPNHPSLLLGWIAGEEAQTMEKLPLSLVSAVCVELLQIFMGRTNIPPPKCIIRSSWHSDPFSLGSYSFLHAGRSVSDCQVLAECLPDAENPRVLFAGEATSQNYYSTAHGAYLSGKRDAIRILKLG